MNLHWLIINFIQTFLNMKTWLPPSSTGMLNERQARLSLPHRSCLSELPERAQHWSCSVGADMNLSLSCGTSSRTDHTTQVSVGYTDKGRASTVVTAHQVLCFTGINLLASYSSSTGKGCYCDTHVHGWGNNSGKVNPLAPVVGLEFESRPVQVSVPFFRCALLQE